MLGAQTFQVQKWPAGGFTSRRGAPQGDAPPAAHARERRGDPRAGQRWWTWSAPRSWDFGVQSSRTAASRPNPNISICGGTPEYSAEQHALRRARPQPLADGRARRAARWRSSATRSRQKLFPFVGPDRPQRSSVDGRKYQVVGVFDEKKSAFGGGFDNYVLMPVTTFMHIYGMTDQRRLRALGQHHGAGEDARAARRCDRGDPPGAAARARRQAGRGGQLRLLQQREPDHPVQQDDRGREDRAPSSSASSRWSSPASAS